jgi:hypothetical protein
MFNMMFVMFWEVLFMLSVPMMLHAFLSPAVLNLWRSSHFHLLIGGIHCYFLAEILNVCVCVGAIFVFLTT